MWPIRLFSLWSDMRPPKAEGVKMCCLVIPQDGGGCVRSNGEVAISNGEVVISNGEVAISNGEVVISNGEVAISYGEVAISNGEVVISNGEVVISKGKANNLLQRHLVDHRRYMTPSQTDTDA